MEQLTISCSPNTYKRVKNDEGYMLQVTRNVLEEQGCSFSQVTFTQTMSPEMCVPEQTENTEANEESIFTPITDITNDDENSSAEKLNWHDSSIKLMLSLMEELWPKLGKSIHLETKGKMYKLIAERMANKGYKYTPIQIENKFRGMERIYKKMVLHNRQTGRNRQSCSYESELNRILGERKGINPEFLLDSNDVAGTSRSPGPTDDNSDTDHSVKDDMQSPTQVLKKRSKLGLREKVIEKMEEMAAERKIFHSKVLDFLQKKMRGHKREKT